MILAQLRMSVVFASSGVGIGTRWQTLQHALFCLPFTASPVQAKCRVSTAAAASAPSATQLFADEVLRDAPAAFKPKVQVMAKMLLEAEEQKGQLLGLQQDLTRTFSAALTHADEHRKHQVVALHVEVLKLKGMFNARGMIEYMEGELRKAFPEVKNASRFSLWRYAVENDSTTHNAFLCIKKALPNMFLESHKPKEDKDRHYKTVATFIQDIYQNMSSDMHRVADDLRNANPLATAVVLSGDNLSHNHLTVMACLGEAWTIPVTIMQQKASITKAAEEFLREKVVQATSEDEAS